MRLPNQTTVVGGGPATVRGGVGGVQVGGGGGAMAGGGGFGRRRGFYGGAYWPYSAYGYSPYSNYGFSAFSSPYWFGGWPYSYPFGFGYAYPGWTAPYSPYPRAYVAPQRLAATNPADPFENGREIRAAPDPNPSSASLRRKKLWVPPKTQPSPWPPGHAPAQPDPNLRDVARFRAPSTAVGRGTTQLVSTPRGTMHLPYCPEGQVICGSVPVGEDPYCCPDTPEGQAATHFAAAHPLPGGFGL